MCPPFRASGKSLPGAKSKGGAMLACTGNEILPHPSQRCLPPNPLPSHNAKIIEIQALSVRFIQAA